MKAKVKSKGDAKAYMKKMQARFKGKRHVAVGFPKGKVSGEDLNKAVWNEFGTKDIPERPFLRNTMKDNKRLYVKILKKGAKSIVRGEYNIDTALSRLGIQIQGDIQNSILTLKSPPNKAATIRKKGSSNPLIDKGKMRGAVTWQKR